MVGSADVTTAYTPGVRYYSTDETIDVVVSGRRFGFSTYLASYVLTECVVEVPDEELNLTNWRGLSRYFVGFKGTRVQLTQVRHVIRQPMRDYRQKRRHQLQIMSKNLH